MLTKIDNSTKQGRGAIRVLYPGSVLSDQDTGLATIGRIDQAAIPAGSFIAMHPHINDEILTYLRRGQVRHTDSVGSSRDITPQRLMLMKAGSKFFHEEHVSEDAGTLTGLQIFIRPEQKDLEPEVTFYDLPEINSTDAWRLLAGRADSGAPLTLRSSTWIYDRHVTDGAAFRLPTLPHTALTSLLYVVEGAATVGGAHLGKGESLIIQDEQDAEIRATEADLVLFVTDEQSAYYGGGMYSGNQYALVAD